MRSRRQEVKETSSLWSHGENDIEVRNDEEQKKEGNVRS